MNDFSYNEMAKNLDKYCSNLINAKICDLGSLDINGTYKSLMKPSWSYLGIDIQSGPNVDLVMPEEYVIPLDSNYFDLIISGSCLEHVKNPFKLMKEAIRVLKPNGLAIITAPFRIVIHEYPLDCWRFLPDGMRAVMEESGLEVLDVYLKEMDESIRLTRRQIHCWGVGKKI